MKRSERILRRFRAAARLVDAIGASTFEMLPAILMLVIVWLSFYGLGSGGQPLEPASSAPVAHALGSESAFPIPPSALGLRVPARITGVVDGDTIEVEFTFRSRVRLPCCWAGELGDKDPERKKAAYLAKMNLAAIAMGKWAVVHVPLGEARRLGDLFTFDRLVADVTLSGEQQSLSACQVKAGHASSVKGGALGR